MKGLRRKASGSLDDVDYRIAKEKYDGLTWDVNNKCLAVAKIDYGKWFGLEFVAMINLNN